jgi:hypothetical protein
MKVNGVHDQTGATACARKARTLSKHLPLCWYGRSHQVLMQQRTHRPVLGAPRSVVKKVPMKRGIFIASRRGAGDPNSSFLPAMRCSGTPIFWRAPKIGQLEFPQM